MSFPLFHPRDDRPLPLTLEADRFAAGFEESDYVELKSGLGGKPLQESIVAFANRDGGVVVIGVEPTGRRKGRRLDSGTRDTIHEVVRTINGSHPRYELHELDVDGVPVTVVQVWELEEGFAQTANGRVLRRRGTRDDALIGEQLGRFVTERAGRRGSAESRSTSWTLDDADADLVRRMETARGWKDWRALRLAERIGLARDDRLTVAGALLLRPDADRELGRAYVEVLRFPSDSGEDHDLRRDFRGALAEQLRAAGDFVLELVGFHTAFRGMERVEIPRLPERVVREVLANAVAHRDYGRSGSSTVVELRPLSLTVRSPGGLPPGVTVDGLRDAQASRNPVLLDALRHFDLAEQRGRGIDLVQDEMQAAMLEAPQFVDRRSRFDVTLSLSSTVTLEERAGIRVLTERGDLRPGDPVALLEATRGGRLTNARVQELVGCTEREARAALARLVQAGLLVRHGHRGSTTYALAPEQERRVSRGLSSADVEALALRVSRERGRVRNADVRDAAGVDRAEALRALDALVARGRLVRTGRGRGTHYTAV